MPLPEAAAGTIDALAADLVRVLAEHDPVLATRLGVHERDAELPDPSAPAGDAFERALGELRARVEAYDAGGREDDVERRALLAMVDSFLASVTLLRPWERNPLRAPHGVTGAIMLLIMWDHLPAAHREAGVRGRCRALSAFLAGARARLAPGEVPAPWASMAVQTARGSTTFLRDVVPVAFPAVADDARAAADAMAAHAAWLADELAPAAGGSYVFGEEGIAHMLARVHLLEETPAQLRARGEELLERCETLLAEAAGDGDWRAALAAARADHPARDRLVASYRAELERLRRFCFEADLVTDPEAPAVLEATPEFLRPLMGYAAYQPPPAFGTARSGKLWVTPPADDDGLADHSHGAIQPITAHEGYPGHHLQMTSIGRLASVARRLYSGSQLMVEGWGLYVEELMHEAGYYDHAGRLAQLSLSHLRACRIVVDVGLHTGEISLEQAVDLLAGRVGLSRATALSEVSRYTMTPTQPFTYLYGAEEIRRVRTAYRQRTGATLRQFHDALLSWGHVPPALAGEALLAAT